MDAKQQDQLFNGVQTAPDATASQQMLQDMKRDLDRQKQFVDFLNYERHQLKLTIENLLQCHPSSMQNSTPLSPLATRLNLKYQGSPQQQIQNHYLLLQRQAQQQQSLQTDTASTLSQRYRTPLPTTTYCQTSPAAQSPLSPHTQQHQQQQLSTEAQSLLQAMDNPASSAISQHKKPSSGTIAADKESGSSPSSLKTRVANEQQQNFLARPKSTASHEFQSPAEVEQKLQGASAEFRAHLLKMQKQMELLQRKVELYENGKKTTKKQKRRKQSATRHSRHSSTHREISPLSSPSSVCSASSSRNPFSSSSSSSSDKSNSNSCFSSVSSRHKKQQKQSHRKQRQHQQKDAQFENFEADRDSHHGGSVQHTKGRGRKQNRAVSKDILQKKAAPLGDKTSTLVTSELFISTNDLLFELKKNSRLQELFKARIGSAESFKRLIFNGRHSDALNLILQLFLDIVQRVNSRTLAADSNIVTPSPRAHQEAQKKSHHSHRGGEAPIHAQNNNTVLQGNNNEFAYSKGYFDSFMNSPATQPTSFLQGMAASDDFEIVSPYDTLAEFDGQSWQRSGQNVFSQQQQQPNYQQQKRQQELLPHDRRKGKYALQIEDPERMVREVRSTMSQQSEHNTYSQGHSNSQMPTPNSATGASTYTNQYQTSLRSLAAQNKKSLPRAVQLMPCMRVSQRPNNNNNNNNNNQKAIQTLNSEYDYNNSNSLSAYTGIPANSNGHWPAGGPVPPPQVPRKDKAKVIPLKEKPPCIELVGRKAAGKHSPMNAARHNPLTGNYPEQKKNE